MSDAGMISEASGRTGADILAEQLLKSGVSHIFFVDAILRDTLIKLRKAGVSTVLAHSEKAAAYMADGFARITGKPGVCMAQSVGAANLAAGLQDAWLGMHPVIAITGRKPASQQDRNAYQEIDHQKAFAAVAKYSGSISTITDVPRVMAQAWRYAVSGTQRPVHIDVAGLMGETLEMCTPSSKQPDPVSPMQRLSLIPPLEQLKAAAREIAEARRVVIVAGTAAVSSAAGPALTEIAEFLDAPFATTTGARAMAPTRHRLGIGCIGSYGNPVTNSIVHEADLVLVVGCQLSDQNTHGWRIPAAGQRIVQIDSDPHEIGRNYPNCLAVAGDPRLAIEGLLKILKESGGGPRARDFGTRAETEMASWRTKHGSDAMNGKNPVSVERLCAEITAALPPDGIVVADTGYSTIWSSALIEFNGAGQSYIRAAGSLGWSFPAALGAKCAAPDRPVICFTGDGAFYYHLPELETALRNDIAIVVVINNNSGFGQGAVNMRARGLAMDDVDHMAGFRRTNFAEIAKAFGVEAVRIEQPGDLASALKSALASNRITVIDVVTDFLSRPPEPWVPPKR
ncbi:thiamine pyrophosphate-binding protein [Bradyrhizobium mercantei]|uniref:thiamine pyrophosphate-binding protein n=1 Tax=Bradyrhizobium mercantei TaxID=1904807 RepID=UPI00135643F5|nr:thiamine pyrophosphate-binding protein [Bradyrhizobium mercantei]